LCFLCMAITQPSSLPIMPSPYQTLIHIHFLAIPAGIQMNSRWQDANPATSPRCSFYSSPLDLEEAVINIGWRWLNITSTINGKPRKDCQIVGSADYPF
jgi:hypothetical protein